MSDSEKRGLPFGLNGIPHFSRTYFLHPIGSSLAKLCTMMSSPLSLIVIDRERSSRLWPGPVTKAEFPRTSPPSICAIDFREMSTAFPQGEMAHPHDGLPKRHQYG